MCVFYAAPILGSYVLNTTLFGAWYDAAVAASHRGDEASDAMCVGAECFRGAVAMCASASAVAAALAVGLAVRTSHVYDAKKRTRRRSSPRASIHENDVTEGDAVRHAVER